MAKKIYLGKVGITTAGEYNTSKTYERLSCVFYNGESWISTMDVPVGERPQEGSTYWQKVASRGGQGIQGEKGEQGIQGVQGPQGNSGYQGAAGELEVVNNLTRGGESSALSAEQGKVLKQEITELSAEINGALRTPSFSAIEGAYNNDGELGLVGTYSHTSPILCKKGETIYAIARNDLVALAAIYKTNSNGDYISTLVTGSNTGEVTERTTTLSEDCYISCSYRSDYGLSLRIQQPSINDNINDVAEIAKNAENKVSSFGSEISSIKDSIIKNKLDRRHTYIQVTTRNGLGVNLSNMYDGDAKLFVDWGDGSNEVEVKTSADLNHQYAVNGTYIIILRGCVKFPNKAIYDKDNVDAVYVGSIVTELASLSLYLNKYLKEVHFLGNTIPTIASNALLTSGSYRTKYIVVPDTMISEWGERRLWSLGTAFTLLTNESRSIIYNRAVEITVGSNGDFANLRDAISYASTFHPIYFYDSRLPLFLTNFVIKILSGTIISEQILLQGIDLSYITITYEDYTPPSVTDALLEQIAEGSIVFDVTEGYNSVAVDARTFADSSHDTRGDVCLFHCEDGAVLPTIGCVFKLTTPHASNGVAGIVCNRGSRAVVKSLCGFIGFNDGVIANNESSITIREGITMNCGRWGCHARHNGEVSARSVIAVGCATDARYSDESAALCADRIADLDGREGWVSCGNAFAVRNTSRMNCNGTHVLGTTDETAIINATAVSVGNFTSLYIDAGVKIDQSQGAMISVSEYTFRESYAFNEVTNKGIIYK